MDFSFPEINTDIVNKFLEGKNPMERIVNIECGYNEKFVKVTHKNNLNAVVTEEPFYPFLWAKRSACLNLCNGDRQEVKKLLNQYRININVLHNVSKDGSVHERMENGYIFIFQASEPMTYNRFLRFFEEAGNPVYVNDRNKTAIPIPTAKSEQRQYLAIPPIEQFMVRSGKRMFKGYDDYDHLHRMIWDIETQGLDPYRHRITQIGVRSNKGYEKIISVFGETEEELNANELAAIREMLYITTKLHPDVITGHNSENFDWNFLIVACERLGTTMKEVSKEFFKGNFIYKRNKPTVLKLGGEVEYFKQTTVPGFNLTDSLHAIRRAQAIDSNMQKANLKYVTKYSKLNKVNRVYIQGDQINNIWSEKQPIFAHNDKNGDWYKIADETPIKEDYNEVTGQYIVERYLLDDLYETDKVELRYNQANFLVCKILPTSFTRTCTMGTAAIWKLIMLAWSYENGLAIPSYGTTRSFTGGLSRLLTVGFIKNVVKLDYNSLYPSIMLTWMVKTDIDISDIILHLVDYILTKREEYKDLKGVSSDKANEIKKLLDDVSMSDEELLKIKEEVKKWESEAGSNDKKQLPLKILANSMFGSLSSEQIFNWGDINCGETITCIGRQSLRLMVKWFEDIDYKTIVLDTDGVNFKYPDILRYTNTNPYIGKGLNRNTKLGKEYTGVYGDVAEFNDLFMRGKMGLGVDEFCVANGILSRKNYFDLFPDGKIKLVGNTIKSKRMPGYIENFLNTNIRVLAEGNGQQFIENYYNYIEKIYNYQIPLRDIASKGKIKRSINDYIEDMKTLTKAGRPKSRQSWYELAIKHKLNVDVGDTVYYINNGTSKSHSDVKKITVKYIKLNGEEVQLTTKTERELFYAWITEKYGITEINELKIKLTQLSKDEKKVILKNAIIREDITVKLNCVLLESDIVEADDDTFCNEETEYNVQKYIDQFNKRIKPLLVCFDRSIREDIQVKTPSDRKYFTIEQTELCSGQPSKPSDQDTMEDLMTMEDKEIKFWMTNTKIEPPFLIECGMDWEKIQSDYIKRVEEMERLGLIDVKNEYDRIIDELTEEDVDDFIEKGKIPSSLLRIVDEDPTTNNLIDIRYGKVIGNIFDIMDKDFSNEGEKEFIRFTENNIDE